MPFASSCGWSIRKRMSRTYRAPLTFRPRRRINPHTVSYSFPRSLASFLIISFKHFREQKSSSFASFLSRVKNICLPHAAHLISWMVLPFFAMIHSPFISFLTSSGSLFFGPYQEPLHHRNPAVFRAEMTL